MRGRFVARYPNFHAHVTVRPPCAHAPMLVFAGMSEDSSVVCASLKSLLGVAKGDARLQAVATATGWAIAMGDPGDCMHVTDAASASAYLTSYGFS